MRGFDEFKLEAADLLFILEELKKYTEFQEKVRLVNEGKVELMTSRLPLVMRGIVGE